MPVYRYQYVGTSIEELNKLLPGSASFSDIASKVYLDLTANVSEKADLDDVMAQLGFAFESEDPAASAAEQSASGIPAESLDSGMTALGEALVSDGSGGFTYQIFPVISVNGLAGVVVIDFSSLQGGTLAELNALISDASLIPETRALSAGAGLTGGGDLSADRSFDVGANADGSIVVNADDIQVGVLATDAQHGDLGGGSLHAVVTPSVAGFMAPADKTKLDGISGGGEVGAAKIVTLYDGTTRSTTGGVFVSGLGGATISPPEDGDYFVIFEGDADSSNSSGVVEVALFKNGVQVPESTRTIGPSSSLSTTLVHDILDGLLATDDIGLRFRKVQGPGSVSLGQKRITLLKVQ